MTENRTVADDQFIDSDSLDERFKDLRALQKEVAELLYTKRSLLFFEKPGLTGCFYPSVFHYEKKLRLLSAKIEEYKFEIKQIQAILNGQDKSLKDVVKQSKSQFAAVKTELKECEKPLKLTF